MCTLAFAFRTFENYPLIFLGNRDEFYDRPTTPAVFWKDAHNLLAGRDMKYGGTWLGLTRRGRFATITNYRDLKSHREHLLSRGIMTSGYLLGKNDPVDYLKEVDSQKDSYNWFNLLVGDINRLYYYSNRSGETQNLEPGIYGLSNHFLNTPWPKVNRIKELLNGHMAEFSTPSTETLFEILANSERTEDDQLPDTGIGLDWERVLSSIFITSPTYGTRNSTVLIIDDKNKVTFAEKFFRSANDEGTEVKFEFTLEPVAE
ncbi:MAG: NRDE family protein [bacterium]